MNECPNEYVPLLSLCTPPTTTPMLSKFWQEIKIRNAKCKMQNAKCKMQNANANAKCKMQNANAKCK